MCCFILTAFNIFSLSWMFFSSMEMYFGMLLLEFMFYGDYVCFLDPGECFLFHVSGVLDMISLIISSGLFFLYSPSGTPVMWMLIHLIMLQRSLRLFSCFPPPLPLFCSVAVFYTILSSSSFIHSYALVTPPLILSYVFLSLLDFPHGSVVKNLAAMKEMQPQIRFLD